MRLTSKSDRDTTHSMSALDQALTTLHVLGSVVQVIPVVGESLKSATGIVTKICETVKVRLYVYKLAQTLDMPHRR
jgi:hypothetical protein